MISYAYLIVDKTINKGVEDGFQKFWWWGLGLRC